MGCRNSMTGSDGGHLGGRRGSLRQRAMLVDQAPSAVSHWPRLMARKSLVIEREREGGGGIREGNRDRLTCGPTC